MALKRIVKIRRLTRKRGLRFLFSIITAKLVVNLLKRRGRFIDRREMWRHKDRGDLDAQVVGEVRRLHVTLPDSKDWIPNSHRALVGEYVNSPRFVASYSYAQVHCGSMVAMTSNGRVIAESTDRHLKDGVSDISNIIYPAAYSAIVGAVPRVIKRNCLTIEGAVLSLGGSQDWGYGHFLLDYAPKLAAIEFYRQNHPGVPRLLLRKKRRPFQQEVINALGFGDLEIVDIGNADWVQCEKLLISSHSRRDFDLMHQANAWDYEWIRSRTEKLRAYGERECSTRRILVSRANARWRSLLNEVELFDALRPLGFELIEPGHVSVYDQIRKFAGAEIIVGAQGTGLVNMVFAQNAKIVEILAEKLPIPLHFILSRQLGFKYACVPAAMVPRDGETTVHGQNLIVDVQRVVRVVEELIDQ